MPLQMQSKFDSTCKKCGIKIKADDTIHKVDDHWCKNTNCPNPPVSKDISTGDYQDIHAEVWEFAVNQANKALPESDKVGRSMVNTVSYYCICQNKRWCDELS